MDAYETTQAQYAALRSDLTSFWLKGALDANLRRDRVDAQRDALTLYVLFDPRREALPKTAEDAYNAVHTAFDAVVAEHHARLQKAAQLRDVDSTWSERDDQAQYSYECGFNAALDVLLLLL